MKEIILTKGKVAFVDDEDYDLVKDYKWRAKESSHTRCFYAIATIPIKDRPLIQMHRLILGLTDPNIQVDHINGDGLDNRRYNLRACTASENRCNRGKSKNNTSGYKGVCFHKASKRWRAKIRLKNKFTYLGDFHTPEEAYAAYCKAALELHGEFANLG